MSSSPRAFGIALAMILPGCSGDLFHSTEWGCDLDPGGPGCATPSAGSSTSSGGSGATGSGGSGGSGGADLPPGCSDRLLNGSETDVDCGGGTCSPCVHGKICTTDDDCVIGICTGAKCGAICTSAPAFLVQKTFTV
ncbi:MAG: hypothetical protein WKG00_31755, partial [Polyangiaceae bacterium]